MVVQDALNNLKDKPHDEKKVVAGSIAVFVVIVLLIGWGFMFVRKIQRGSVPTLEGTAVPSDQFDAQFLQQTQQQLNEMYRSSADDLRAIRESGGPDPYGTPPEEDNVEGFGATE